MHLSFSDWIGFTGVTILLLAFLSNLRGLLSRDSLLYILLNISGAGLACLASYLINYIPFIILEASWTFVSLLALIGYWRKNIS